MIVDILKFAFLYLLTLFAFSCGMNQLLWFYSDLEKKACEELNDMINSVRLFDYFSLFETTQTLFWAAFGLIDLQNFELEGIKPFTRFWGMLMFGTYSVINVIVLLNLLIAMMNHSYQLVSVSSVSVHMKDSKAKASRWPTGLNNELVEDLGYLRYLVRKIELVSYIIRGYQELSTTSAIYNIECFKYNFIHVMDIMLNVNIEF
ncbi:Transient receptor potential-gamma protein [Armadillidium nasatum]|uniref:Transient receptor potential-gamma protein n=1 Tax=Armadillidium nasatum TaxID=96803 RepID=A0A5N5T606_9CRUS|nr:Transient receptor potential-gamma protein [Armadillidium nasatum]